MEQETTINYQNPTEKVYKDREIWVGTLLGGILVAGYMVAKNYKVFGEANKVRKTWFVTIAATVFLFYISFFAPYLDRVPNHIFALVCAGIVVVLVQIYQGEKIRTHIRAGRQIHSWWKTLGVTVLGGIVTIAMFLGTAYLLDAVENATIATKTYGAVKHEISYDKSNISEGEVDAIAEVFNRINFFDDQGKWYVYARKVESNYEISLSTTKSALINQQNLEFFTQLRNDTQSFFPNNKIIINLVVGNFDKIEKRIE